MITTFDDLLIIDKEEKSILEVKKLEKLSYEEYNDMIVDFYETIFDNYWINKDIKVIFKFDKASIELTFAQALMELIFWIGNKKFSIPINIEYMVDVKSLESEKIKNNCEYLAVRLISTFKNSDKKDEIMRFLFTNVLEWCYKIGKNTCYPQGFTLSLRGISNLAKRNPDFDKILHTTLPSDLSIKETEDIISDLQKKLEYIISTDKYNELYPFLASHKLNKGQFAQVLAQVGYRSDIDKKILPLPTNTSMLNGYQTPTHYINECLTGRDAELTKKNIVRKSGDFSRKIDLLTINLHIDYDVEDCGTQHTILYDIKSLFHLKMAVGKYMVTPEGKLHEITLKDKDLIGKVVPIRSHICCALNNVKNKYKNDGKEYVCKTCFGAQADLVKGIVIGSLPAIRVSNPLSDKAMSLKHQSTSNVISILDSVLNKFFYIDGDEVFIKPDFNYTGMTINISKEYEEAIKGENGDSDGDSELNLKNIILVKKDKKDPSLNAKYKLDEERNGIYLSLSSEMIDKENFKTIFSKTSSDSEYMILDLTKIEPDQPIFNISLANEDVAYYLKQLINLIDGVEIRTYPTFASVIGDFVEIMNNANINCGLVNIESIIYKLVRDKDNILYRPDFDKDEINWKFCPLHESVVNSPNFSLAISFGDINKQLSSANTFEKDGKSAYDPFFATTKGRMKTLKKTSKI